MASSRKVIITCAITGSSHTPTMSPHLPYRPEDIIQQSIEAHRAGAAVIHLHARDPQDGRPSADPDMFRAYLEAIKAETNAVIGLTTGGATGQTIDQRLNVVRVLQPELCTLNLGTMNYGGFPMIPKYQGHWTFDWEEPFLESTRHEPFVSNYADIETMLTVLTEETGVRFEFEAYDVGHIYTLAYYMDAGLVKPPVFLQFVIGTMGGIGPEVDNIVHLKRTADRLLGEDVQWSVLGSGRHQLNVVTVGAIMGSHVRVGLEDSLYLAKGKLAGSNAAQVEKIRRILTELSLDIASADEARELLGLKWLGNVAF
jgi:3,5-dioxohexanoate:acetyl-CoA acetone transferase